LFSSSLLGVELKRCGAFLIVLMTFLTFPVADRRPLPPASAIVGSVELLPLLLLLRFKDPRRKERDSERESGLSF
jgi:hypothetical protein